MPTLLPLCSFICFLIAYKDPLPSGKFTKIDRRSLNQTLLYKLSYSILADVDEIRTHDTCNPIRQSVKRLAATVPHCGESENTTERICLFRYEVLVM